MLCLTWPHERTAWTCCLADIEASYRSFASTAARYQPVLILCQDAAHQVSIQDHLEQHHIPDRGLLFVCIATDDTWIRDYGPIIVLEDDHACLCDFQFNGWGEQFGFANDNRVNQQLYSRDCFANTQLEPINLILEGGNLDSNGQGHVLTNLASIASNTPRQPVDTEQLTLQLRTHLGVDHIHCINVPGLYGDDTHGHIDTLCRFVDTDTIVYCDASLSTGPDKSTLQRLQLQLEVIAAQFDFHLIALPKPLLADQSQPASYINFVILNNAVLVPQYGHPLDNEACRRFKTLFPHHEVTGIDSRVLIRQSGALHCASMNIPERVFNENCICTTK